MYGMKSIFQYSSFTEYLADELDSRTERNAKYSLRAFARDLSITNSQLSRVLNHKEGISLSSAKKMVGPLKLSHQEAEFFLNLVVAECGRSATSRAKAQRYLKLNKNLKKFKLIQKEFNGLLSKWYYAPLVELLTVKTWPDLKEVAVQLDITRAEIENAVQVLETMGYIRQNSKEQKWTRGEPYVKVESPISSEHIKNYHKKIIQRGMTEIDKQAIANRKYLSTVFSFNKTKLETIRRELEKFNSYLLEKYCTESDADSVYVFAMQFYEMN